MVWSVNALNVQALHNGLKFVVGQPQIAFVLGDTIVVKFVHDERQVYPAHARMVPPGFAKAMGSKVAVKTHVSAYGSNKLPALPAFDRTGIIVVFGVEENEVVYLSFRKNGRLLEQSSPVHRVRSETGLHFDSDGETLGRSVPTG